MNLGSILATVALTVVIGFTVARAHLAFDAALPSDMPTNAKFVQTGFNVNENQPLGQWVACRVNVDHETDWCRVTNEAGTVVYEGQFLPVDSETPVDASGLKFARLEASKLWISAPAEQTPVPALPLADGQLLVPAGDRPALLARWSAHPEEVPQITPETSQARSMISQVR